MIKKETIDKIFDTARIEEVVGDFVQLKKRGTNRVGLCPFHNEKTPSFNVNPSRNIFKCFGCGKGGTPVNFIMEHEHCAYPDALRYLAKKYQIEIEEEAESPELQLLRDEKESMLVLNSFAQKSFSENLLDPEEGKSIGLAYFKERGFSEDTIRKFQLGYSFNSWNAFTGAALKNGYKKEFLLKSGLSVEKDHAAGEVLFDRFRGRVIFPIHNLSGRVIAFGGRLLKKDEKAAKYVNSPESEIYHKSQTLYGIYFAKNAIVQHDACYLAEGYTDVISLHQAGIENVVASSGTALTVEQIRLIRRYTNNITILYDGDEAGIKASVRGIDLILEEGMNVRVVLFPDGDDPDSFSRQHSSSEVHAFITGQAKDFVVFKTGLLLNEVKDDPLRKAALIREVVETISRIPDPITRATYVRHCSALMDIGEQVLMTELNAIRRAKLKKEKPAEDIEWRPEAWKAPGQDLAEEVHAQEAEIIRLMLNYGNHDIHFYDGPEGGGSDQGKEAVITVSVAKFITEEISRDQISFRQPVFARMFRELTDQVIGDEKIIPEAFLQSEDPEVSRLAVEMLSQAYVLSENWETMHNIFVPKEETMLKQSVENAVYHLKNRQVMKMLSENQQKLKEAHANGEEYMHLIEHHRELEEVKMKISKVLGIDVLR